MQVLLSALLASFQNGEVRIMCLYGEAVINEENDECLSLLFSESLLK